MFCGINRPREPQAGLLSANSHRTSRRRRIRAFLTVFALSFAVGRETMAGPPFVSDDPEPTDAGHWEIYNFADGTEGGGVVTGQAGLDLNYGAAKDLQLTATLPAAFTLGDQRRIGTGDAELAAKYRFLHQTDGGAIPDVAFFPRVFVPSANHYFGTGHTNLLLPLWAEKDSGPWSLFGGGGYMINPGPRQRNFWISGLVCERAVSNRLNVGLEIYNQTADTIDTKPFAGLNLGITYKKSDHWSLLVSGGPGIENAREGRYAFYLALKADY